MGERDEASRLAARGWNSAPASALAQKASVPELVLGASALLDCKVPRYADAPLALILVRRALALNADDIDTLQTAAKAYWMNGDRAQAARTLEHALALVSPTPTPLRQEIDESLQRYR